MSAVARQVEAPVFEPGDLIQAVKDCQSVTGDRIEAGRMYEVAALDRGGWPILASDQHGGGGWAPGQFRRASPTAVVPPTVPVPRGPLEALTEAVADWRASSGGQVGECRDAVVAVAVALADELEEQR